MKKHMALLAIAADVAWSSADGVTGKGRFLNDLATDCGGQAVAASGSPASPPP